MNKHISGVFLLLAGFLFSCNNNSTVKNANDSTQTADGSKTSQAANTGQQKPTLDTARYHQLMAYLANGDTSGRWPVKNAPLPLPGAILPFNRVVAYYGNLYSNRMGALGKWPKKEMIPKAAR
jgi:hypothetical protein